MKSRARLAAWIATAAWLLFLSAVTYLADHHRARPLFTWVERHPGSDKLGHFLMIGIWAFLVNVSIGCREFHALKRQWLVGSAMVAALTVLEELSQILIPTRTFDLLDLAADAAGILAFGWLARRFCRKRERFTRTARTFD